MNQPYCPGLNGACKPDIISVFYSTLTFSNSEQHSAPYQFQLNQPAERFELIDERYRPLM